VLAQDDRRRQRAAIIGLALFGAVIGLLIVLPYYLSLQRQQEESLLMQQASPEMIRKCQASGAEGLSDCQIWQEFVGQHFAAREAVQMEIVAEISSYVFPAIFYAIPVVSAATILLSAYVIAKYWNEMRRNVFGILGMAGIMAVAIYAAWFFYLIVTIDD
jgi:hypothetical protein